MPFADGIFYHTFGNENYCITLYFFKIQIPIKFVPGGPIDNDSLAPNGK